MKEEFIIKDEKKYFLRKRKNLEKEVKSLIKAGVRVVRSRGVLVDVICLNKKVHVGDELRDSDERSKK